MLDRFFFVLSEAIVALKRNLGMAFAATSTIAVSLYLLTGLTYAYFGLSNFANSMTGKFEMYVYLKEDTSKSEISDTAKFIRQMKGVQSVNWIPKEKAWEKKQQEDPSLTAGIPNPLPDALKVMVRDIKKGDAIADEIRKLAVVDRSAGVNYMKAEQHAIGQWIDVFKWVGLSVGGLLIVTAAILIFNAIRLTVVSRRIEIRIMQLVGASYSTVYMPFIIEGLLQGLVGGATAGGMLAYSYHLLNQLVVQYDALGGMTAFPTGLVVGLTSVVGAFYGVVCSGFALFRLQLRYR